MRSFARHFVSLAVWMLCLITFMNTSELHAGADYSGVYMCEVRGDDTIDALMKIEQAGTSVAVYLQWALPDPFSGTVVDRTVTLDAGIVFTFDEEGEKFTGTWTKGKESGTVSGYSVDPDMWSVPEKIEPDETRGFSLPYILFIPHTVESKTVFLVQELASPTHTDNMDIHLDYAFNTAFDRMVFVRDLKTPLIIPVIPHTADNHDDYQGLGRGALISTKEDLVRVDLQLIAMIEDARERLRQKGIYVADKIFMNGYSISGYFTNRFAALHPDKVIAAAIGAPGGWPIAPLSEWKGYTMNYPVGIADLNKLIDITFNAELFKTIPLYMYMGADDTNDAIGRFTPEEQIFLNGLGATPYERWPEAKAMYDSIGCNAEFVSYPGVEHTVTEEMWADILVFFQGHMPRFFPWNTFLSPMLNINENRAKQ